jgi:hypothetical protein
MNTRRIIGGTITGTSLMTAYSYLISNLSGTQLREPELLDHLLHHYFRSFKKSNVGGWLIHYGVGLSFVAIYKQLWRNKKMKSAAATVLLGVANGAIAVCAWRTLLKTLPFTPTDLNKFSRHLITAHILFALGSKAADV